MSYAEIIQALHKRSGKSVKEYAESVHYSPTHISHILNRREPGSLKAAQACLRHANIELEDCLSLPESGAHRDRNEAALRILKAGLTLDETRDVVIDLAEFVQKRIQQVRSKPPRKRT